MNADQTEQAQHHLAWEYPGWSGLASGVVYGVLLRLIAGGSFGSFHPSGVMTATFLMLGPFAVGFLAVYPTARVGATRISEALWLSWAAVTIMCAVTAVALLEGFICIVMLLPLALVISMLGGFLALLIARRVRSSKGTLACIALLPFVGMALESQVQAPTQIRTVESTITIHAAPTTVWQQIQSVPAIAPSELNPTWTHSIGFPRPIAATLSYPGVGGVRKATFEHGLTFFETVTTWQPDQRLAFSIKADTAHIPSTTLDEHVTIGGPYFDVLDGEYPIEPLPQGDVLLHLTSHQRLSTDLNGYTGMWTEAVMQDLQNSILQVIQHRCEHVTS